MNEDLAQHIFRTPFSVEKMTLESPTDLVIYRSRLNAKINRNFESFSATSAPGTTRLRGRLRAAPRHRTPTNLVAMQTRCPTTKTR